MNTFWKLVRIPLAVILILLLIMQARSCINQHNNTDTQYRLAVKDTISYYRDKYWDEHAQVSLLEGDISEAKSLYADLIQSKTKELAIKERNLRGIINLRTARVINLDSLGELYARIDTVRVADTVHYVQRFRTKYIKVIDSLSITQYTKRVSWLRRKAMIDVISYTPGVRVTELSGFQVRKYTNNLTLGPSLTWALTSNGMKLVPGISLQWSLLGIHIGRRR
jgi:hypothetical protein